METIETGAAQAFFTPEEYLAKEWKALTKSEYRDGQIYPRPRLNHWHNLITVNAACELHIQLRNRVSEVYLSISNREV